MRGEFAPPCVISPTSCRCSTPRGTYRPRRSRIGLRPASASARRTPSIRLTLINPVSRSAARLPLAPACLALGQGSASAAPESSSLPRARAAPVSRSLQGRAAHRRRCSKCPPSAMSAARLRSVARRPPAASLPGRLPGALLPFRDGGARLGEGFPLRCRQRFARPRVATRRCRGRDNRPTSGASGPVLSY